MTRSFRRGLACVWLVAMMASVATPAFSPRLGAKRILDKQPGAETRAEHDQRMGWWREARFGMFIHWGLYAVPAGEYQGKRSERIGEWIMEWANIPRVDYQKFAARYNPVKFNASEWVRIAKDAGMRYIVITSKHHDGFSMYGSSVSDYDIVNSTPYGKDPIKALATEAEGKVLNSAFTIPSSIGITRPSMSMPREKILRQVIAQPKCDRAAKQSMSNI